MVEEHVDINILANIINSDWGNSSMSSGGKTIYSVKAKIISDSIEVVYTTIAQFASEDVLRVQMPRYDDEALQRIDAYVKLMKSKYKEATSTTLTCKQRTTYANIEMLSMSPYSPVKSAYYRRHVIYDM